MAISRTTCAASDSKDPRHQAALLTSGPGIGREALSVGVAQLLCIVGKELLLQRAHVSVLCLLQFTLASAAFPVSSRSGFLYGHAPRAGGRVLCVECESRVLERGKHTLEPSRARASEHSYSSPRPRESSVRDLRVVCDSQVGSA